MVVNKYHAQVIDGLREAAAENQTVRDLLRVLSRSFPGLPNGGGEFLGDERDRYFLVAAQSAFAFVCVDHNEDDC